MSGNQFSKLYFISAAVWAIGSFLIVDLLVNLYLNFSYTPTFAVFLVLWCAMIAPACLPLLHQYVAVGRPKRKAVLWVVLLLCAVAFFAMFTTHAPYYSSRKVSDGAWIPLLWGAMYLMFDALLEKSSLKVTNALFAAKAHVQQAQKIDILQAFNTISNEFRAEYLKKFPNTGNYFQVGTLSLSAVKDFMARKFGHEMAYATFLISYSKVYKDIVSSDEHKRIEIFLEKSVSQAALTESEEPQPYIHKSDLERVRKIVNDPKYAHKDRELRLPVAMFGLFVGGQITPPLTEEKDRPALLKLIRRSFALMDSTR